MPGRTVLRSILAFTVVAVLSAARPLDSGPTIRLEDLSQRASVRPSTFQVTYHVALTGLRWRGWGAPVAVSTGTLDINTCQPTCAGGRYRLLRNAELQVRGVRIDQGRRFYRQYRVTGPALTAADRLAYAHWTNAYVPSDFR
ncbi:hypothetical protein [Streptomyces silvisoli]|uniref:Uncharacterized protein n=1 Tax=Streptomyces silvisoli TaxID=3034235 RepID=A0ABT5ZE85_9ACTN|nr:hypothetical protein [Streptomyces silvisoli]MDF3288135.1 hypothetical protein [Streptomyces silvisoli]